MPAYRTGLRTKKRTIQVLLDPQFSGPALAAYESSVFYEFSWIQPHDARACPILPVAFADSMEFHNLLTVAGR